MTEKKSSKRVANGAVASVVSVYKHFKEGNVGEDETKRNLFKVVAAKWIDYAASVEALKDYEPINKLVVATDMHENWKEEMTKVAADKVAERAKELTNRLNALDGNADKAEPTTEPNNWFGI